VRARRQGAARGTESALLVATNAHLRALPRIRVGRRIERARARRADRLRANCKRLSSDSDRRSPP
jgi:hypothetical protein